MAHLFDNYSKDTRPGEDGRPTAVDIIMTPVTLISLDEETEAAQVKSAIEFSWSDPYLAWDPADYNGISKIFKLQSELWVPTVYIGNSLEKSNSFEFCDDSKIPIHSDGSMQWTIIEVQYLLAIVIVVFSFWVLMNYLPSYRTQKIHYCVCDRSC